MCQVLTIKKNQKNSKKSKKFKSQNYKIKEIQGIQRNSEFLKFYESPLFPNFKSLIIERGRATIVFLDNKLVLKLSYIYPNIL